MQASALPWRLKADYRAQRESWGVLWTHMVLTVVVLEVVVGGVLWTPMVLTVVVLGVVVGVVLWTPMVLTVVGGGADILQLKLG
ncbi:unnamed protein product [Arctogadus glacialis]